MAEKVNWLGYMPVVRIRLKDERAWKGLLKWESWVMSVVHVTTLVEARGVVPNKRTACLMEPHFAYTTMRLLMLPRDV